MKFYNIIIKYRFWLSLFAVALAILLNVTGKGKAGFLANFSIVFFRCNWHCQSFFYWSIAFNTRAYGSRQY